mmetsp:Transcript_8561/g.24571  ORF Transcript_8561/g.24571 Transcript_8561/m.24571 type:complete len:332 (-) Transcript_8561:202-1197(-)|eukprot:CAMPEP_0117648510 /NCGR_PEP_ID=MMETSP0804-20121206/446_1 /TAXON_ID=1074897 /ORGANISM="Tetraselmis astigmatica, Strain CCMP880" /LENGTH=331 /DNA_ID=CAMNT_0005454123 /DNA_START=292 /DNA_END=1287 /DNA_ORIENTATION=+
MAPQWASLLGMVAFFMWQCHLGATASVVYHPSVRHHSDSYDSTRCDLCADNWLFILAAGGRTGSTTSMSMFNSVPSFEVSGEHAGLLIAKQIEFELLEEQEQKHLEQLEKGEMDRLQARNPSHRVDWLAMKCNVQNLAKKIVFGDTYQQRANATRVLGFKEIRYTTVRMLRFLSDVFPCARFVFPLRLNGDAKVHAPEFAGAGAAITHRQWHEETLLVKEVHARFPHLSSLIPLETLSTEQFNQVLHDELGVRGCSFNAVIHDNANGGYEADGAHGRLISGDCDFSDVDFRLTDSEIRENKRAWADLLSDSRFEGFFEEDLDKYEYLMQTW